jgi:hypothetical protein
MRVFVAEVLIASAAVSALTGCVSSPPVTQGYGLLTYPCYSALTRPLLPAEVPGVSVVAGYGALTGVVFRAGTGTGIDSASIILSLADSATTTQSNRRRLTGQTGDFAFDSVVPGRYLLRVHVAWEHAESSFVSIAANRIDTLRIAMPPRGPCSRS